MTISFCSKRVFAFTFCLIVLAISYLGFPQSKVNALINEFDSSFSEDGFVYGGMGGVASDTGYDVAVQGDGGIIVAGSEGAGNYDMIVWRYLPDGSLDPQFGNGSCTNGPAGDESMGCVVFNGAMLDNSDDYAYSVDVDNQDRIIIGGSIGNRLAVWRLLPDGSDFDISFGNGSCVNGSISNPSMGCFTYLYEGLYQQRINDISIYDDGAILAGGQVYMGIPGYRSVLVRLQSSGVPDSSFDPVEFDGVLLFGPFYPDISSFVTSLDVGEAESIIAAGYALTPWIDNGYFCKFKTNGSFDENVVDPMVPESPGCRYFGSFMDTTIRFEDIIFDSNENILTVGLYAPQINQYLSAWKFDSNGNPDLTFGQDGRADIIPIETAEAYGYNIDEVVPGKYLITGQSRVNGSPDETVLLINNIGNIDTSFGINGYAISERYSFSETLGYSSVLFNNKIYTSGFVYTNITGERDMALWSYLFSYQISNLDSSLSAVDEYGNNIEVGSENGLLNLNQVFVKNNNGIMIVEMNANFINDLNWANLRGSSDLNTGKTYVSGLSAVEGLVGNHTIYIPYLNKSTGIYICPSAESLEDITENCLGGYEVLEGNQQLSQVSIGNQSYWTFTLASGTGGMNLFELELPILPDTALSTFSNATIGLLLIFIGIGSRYLLKRLCELNLIEYHSTIKFP